MSLKTNKYINCLKKTDIFSQLTQRELESCVDAIPMIIKHHEKNSILINQGEPFSQLIIIISGRLVGYKLQEGRFEKVIRYFNPGHAVALEALVSNDNFCHMQVRSSKPGKYLSIDFKSLINNTTLHPNLQSQIRGNLGTALSNECIHFINKSFALSHHTVQQKALSYLYEASERYKSATFDIGMNQGELSKYLGVDRSSLSESLNKLRQDGVLEFRGSVFKLLQL